MTEYLVENFVGATLADITSSALSLTLAANPGTAIPATGNFRLRLSDPDQTVEEVILVTGRSGAVLSWPDTAHRGIEDPGGVRPAAAWPAGSIVEIVPTVDGFTQWLVEHPPTHAATTSQTADQHHAQAHAHSGADSSGTVAHSATTGRTANDHHAQSHGHTGADSSGTVAHSATTGQTADQHHTQAHGHTGADSSGTVAHSATTGRTANDHHAQSHAHNGADSSGTVAHSATTGQTANDHHAQNHGLSAHTGSVLPGAANESLGAHYLDLAQIAAPTSPPSGTRRVFTNSGNGHLSAQSSAGATIDLEAGGITSGDPWPGPWEYIVVPVGGQWNARRRDISGFAFTNNANPGSILQQINNAIKASGKTGGVLTGDVLPCTTQVVLDATGSFWQGMGWSKDGGALTTTWQLQNTIGGSGTPFIYVRGPNITFSNLGVDANNHATAIQVGAAGNNEANRFVAMNCQAASGREYGLRWESSDGEWTGGEVRNQPGSSSDPQIMAAWMNGANINVANCHFHGSGALANNGRTIKVDGQNAQFAGCHFEAGVGSDAAWNVEVASDKATMGACKWGHFESGGEVLVSGGLVAGAITVIVDALDTDNAYDMVSVTSGGELELTSCQAFFASSDTHRWRYAVKNAGGSIVSLAACRFQGRAGAPWDNVPSGGHAAITWNGSKVAGNA